MTGATAHWTVAAAAIEDIDLAVSPGQRVAVVGPSGSGKSTLAAVLMGFLPYTGSVRLSGVEVGDADGDDLRQHVGMLTQQAHIFDTTIADNVRIGEPDATDDEVMARPRRRRSSPTGSRACPRGRPPRSGPSA